MIARILQVIDIFYTLRPEQKWPTVSEHFQMHFLESRLKCKIDVCAIAEGQWVFRSLQWRHNERNGVWDHQPIVYSAVYSGTDQRKHQRSASLAFVREIHRWPVNSPHKSPVTRKMFPFDDVIMWNGEGVSCAWLGNSIFDQTQAFFIQILFNH